ncbi:MAG: SMC-Scp complex subunit ScpB [Bacilli bacterium]|nr:SMC-Scp complex subunit ScpB [Bacilli bacterium]
MNKKAVLEGLLFVSGDEGLTKEKIKSILEIDDADVNGLLSELLTDYSSDDRGVTINKFGDVYKIVTKREHADYYKKIVDGEINEKLSNSALETLSIIAYNGPVTRVMIDEIRGVSSAHIIRKLVFKNLIKEVGRSELPGKPILYGVTNQFLDYFGLKSIDDLPKIELDEDNSETELYDSKYSEK